ncbi:ankyrin repeat domain-containing protein [bacterium]|nr:ankyrin repeat domain-containing protein [bacterium]
MADRAFLITLLCFVLSAAACQRSSDDGETKQTAGNAGQSQAAPEAGQAQIADGAEEVEGERSSVWDAAISPDGALKQIKEMGLPFSEDEFVKKVFKHNEFVVHLYIEAGVNPDARDEEGFTALVTAAYRGLEEIVRQLLERGADVNQQDVTTGHTAVIRAANQGHKRIVRMLLDAGADPNILDAGGFSPLVTPAAVPHKEVIELLLAHGADPNLVDVQGGVPLHQSVINEHKDIARLLLDNGAEVDPATDDGSTALFYASGQGDEDFVYMLLAEGADPMNRLSNGWTLLHIIMPYTVLIYLYLDLGVDIDAQGTEGETATMMSIAGSVGALKVFIERGADLSLKTNDGRTVLRVARDTLVDVEELFAEFEEKEREEQLAKWQEMIRLLEEAGAPE